MIGPKFLKKGTTSVSVTVKIIDSTDGTPELGVLFNTAGMDLEYRREFSAVVNITEVTLAALTTVWTTGGFLEIGHGYYRLDVPDAAFASGQDGVQILGTVTGMIVLAPYIQLVDFDPFDNVRLGLTALPNAAAEAAGGLLTRGTGAGQINQSANGQVDVNVERLNNIAQSLLDLKDFADAGYDPATNKVQGVVLVDTTTTNTDVRGTDGANTTTPPTVAAIADGVLDEDMTGHQTQGSLGQAIGDPVADATTLYQAVVSDAAGDNVAVDVVAVKAETALIVADTNELQVDDVPGLIAALNDISTANVLTQVNAALDTVISELAQAAPAATPTLRTGLMLLYMALRNRFDTNTSATDELAIYNDAGTKIAKKLITDDGSDYSEAEMVAGP